MRGRKPPLRPVALALAKTLAPGRRTQFADGRPSLGLGSLCRHALHRFLIILGLACGWPAALAQLPPIITNQPDSQLVAVGADVTFSVGVRSTTPLRYQWQRYATAIAGATNASLTLTNVQFGDGGVFKVTCVNSIGSTPSDPATLLVMQVSGYPSASLGAEATFTVNVFGGAFTGTYQWQHNGVDIASATNRTLTVTNAQLASAGVYSAVVSNAWGVAAPSAVLVVNSTFQNIQATPGRNLFVGEWIDVNGDGWVDLAGLSAPAGTPEPVRDATFEVFLNARDGSFVSAWRTEVADVNAAYYRGYGDYDNDGQTDVVMGSSAAGLGHPFVFYHNVGGGKFERVYQVSAPLIFGRPIWADLDNDGYLDVLQGDLLGTARVHWNDHDGPPFRLAGPGEPGWELTTRGGAHFTAWGDYNQDGIMDVYVNHYGGSGRLFTGLGGGRYGQATTFPSVTIESADAEWVDYDGDTDLDLVLNPYYPGPLVVCRNDGAGSFARMTAAEVGDLASDSTTCSMAIAWGDYDNDGDLDLYRTDMSEEPAFSPKPGRFYINQGGGRFARIDVGTPTTGPYGTLYSASWGDYDNDGFLDLFGARQTAAGCGVFRNNLPQTGNTNRWLKVRCEGRVSNRDAVGTKVRVKATLGGQERWQLRPIIMPGSGGPLVAHFGLGDATNVDVVRIEWPSGIVQELTNVATNQFLTVTEQGVGILPVWTDFVAGSNYTFRAATTLPQPVQYQWQFNGADLPGETAATLTILNAEQGRVGAYTVTVRGSDGQVLGSAPALLTMPGPPVIAAQPQSQIAVPGDTVTFSVSVLPCNPPATFQWLRSGSPLPGQTNASLVLTNATAATYSVRVSNAAGLTDSDTVALTVARFASQPASVSLGGEIALRVLWTGPAPTAFQWRLNGVDIPGATQREYQITAAKPSDVGQYSAVISGPAGTVTVFAPALVIDPAFTKITTGPPVTDQDGTWGGNARDYDGDGFDDLLLYRYVKNILYRSNGDGTFTSVDYWPPSTLTPATVAWGDLDNDGTLDFFAGYYGARPSRFFLGDGHGSFSSIQTSQGTFNNVALVDFDQDGLLDVFECGYGNINRVLRNFGNRQFIAADAGPLTHVAPNSRGACWADWDDDGWVDVYSANLSPPSRLYRNDGAGSFMVVSGQMTTIASTGDWGDYDNDGDLDLCFAHASAGNRPSVYRNLGGGAFEMVPIGDAVPGHVDFGPMWADYDNDGFLDLLRSWAEETTHIGGRCTLYHNNGDGTFSEITTGSIVTDRPFNQGYPLAGMWFDDNNDGFLDLYVICDDLDNSMVTRNFLYQNNGNANAWLKVKLVGTASNRDAAGAKVRVQARFADQAHWQRRDISLGDLVCGDDPYAHFGLGDAVIVDTVRIEWPSGIVQELTNVATNQFLTVTEEGVGILPFKQMALAGSNYTFRAATTLPGTMSYQWRFNGIDLPGETLATLTVANAQKVNTGAYSVVVNNGTETLTSEAALLYWPEPPVITTQPRSQIAVAGTDVEFSVAVAPSTIPPTFQWRRFDSDIAGATNATLRLTAVPYAQGGSYTVIVSNPAGSIASEIAGLTLVRDASTSGGLGEQVTLRVQYTAPPATSCQWQLNGVDIPGATRFQYVIAAAKPSDVGQYSARVSNAAGTVTVLAPALVVDPTLTTFTKITVGPMVEATGNFRGASWADYDNDGDLDLFVARRDQPNLLYRNDGNNVFAVTNTRLDLGWGAAFNDTLSGAWGDFDNDGDPDLFIANHGGFDSSGGALPSQRDLLCRNDGGGVLTRITTGDPVNDKSWGTASAWADYDNDGHLDLVVSDSRPYVSNPCFLYHNEGNGTFSRTIGGALGRDTAANLVGLGWADYDSDGDMDLFVANGNGLSFDRGHLYCNGGNGVFETPWSSPVVTKQVSARGCAWGDSDNDGDLDLFVGSQDGGSRSAFYQNNGDGTFTSLASSMLVQTMASSVSVSWADYDNDGFLDLLLLNDGGDNFLYRNNGNGAFTRITSGRLVKDPAGFPCAAWGDSDRDGFLDLYVARGIGGSGGGSQKNSLYRNNGNGNGWLIVQCVGRVSNRSGIGAKVRTVAQIRGQSVRQLREITSGDGFQNNYALYAHFGLGDATNVDTVRIEWPSGIVQEFHDVAPRQFLTVTEPTRLKMVQPGVVQIPCWPGMSVGVEGSTDLRDWTPLGTVTNVTGTLEYTDPAAGTLPRRFYRAVGP